MATKTTIRSRCVVFLIGHQSTQAARELAHTSYRLGLGVEKRSDICTRVLIVVRSAKLGELADMLDSGIFKIAVLLVSLLFLFHGCILLFCPDRYIPSYNWGQGTLRLVRKPPLQIGKRFAGLCLSGAIIWFITLPVILGILHPKAEGISFGESPFSQMAVRWDLLGVGIFAIACGYLLFMRTEKTVESLFSADRDKLQDKVTFRLWTIYIQMAALFSVVWSLLPLSNFIKSLHSRP